MRSAVLALLLVLLFAGCSSKEGGDGGTPTPPPPTGPVRDPAWAVAALPLDHDHADRSLHVGLSTPNLRLVGHDPLVTDYHGAPSGGYYCGEVSREGERRYAVVNSFTSDTAIVVVDVTDPAAPEMVGELILQNAHVYDSAITDDGRYAILATSPLDVLYDDPNSPPGGAGGPGRTGLVTIGATWRDACGRTFQGPTDLVPYASGVVLVDLTDPTTPTVTDYRPRPAIGPHSVQSSTIDGTTYVLASTTNLAYTASTFSFFTLEELPVVGGRLVESGEYSANYEQETVAGGAPPLLNGHVDGTIAKHPVTGELVAYLANWDEGLVIVRLDGPGQVTRLSGWGGLEAGSGAGMTGAIHTAYPLPERWDDRAIVVTGQELGGSPSARPTGQITLLDVTDPASPSAVARWTLPVGIQWSGGLTFSTHYVTLVDGVLYTALYHGGVWAADASPEHWPNLPSLGVFLPAETPPSEAVTGSLAPEVLDVLPLDDGSVLVFDSTTGAYTLRLDRSADVPVAAPWEGDLDSPAFPGAS